MNKPSWQELAQLAQARRDASIAAVQPPIPAIPKDLPLSVVHLPAALLSAREVEITELKPEKLTAALASRSITAREVTGAFLRRAGLAQGLVCPLSSLPPNFCDSEKRFLTRKITKANCISELLPQQALARADELDAHMVEFESRSAHCTGCQLASKNV